MRMLKYQSLMSVLLMTMLVSSLRGDVVELTLDQMLKLASTVALGKVTKVTTLKLPGTAQLGESAAQPIKLAEIEVIDLFKGNLNLKKIYYWVSPGLACDRTTAVEGEVKLFLLREGTPFREFPAALVPLIPQFKTITGNQEIYRIVAGGQGRVTIHEIDGEQYILGSRLPVNYYFPKALKVRGYLGSSRSSVGMLKLADLRAYVQKSTAR